MENRKLIVTTRTRIPTQAERATIKKLSDHRLATTYLDLIKGGKDDGNQIALLEDEMRFRWLLRQGIDLEKEVANV